MLVEVLLDALLAAEAVMFFFKGESCDNWEVWLYVWCDVGSRDHSSVDKYVNARVNVMIDDSVYWGVKKVLVIKELYVSIEK